MNTISDTLQDTADEWRGLTQTGVDASLTLPQAAVTALGHRVWEIISGHLGAGRHGLPVATPGFAAEADRLRSESLPDVPADDPLTLVDEVGRLLREGNAHPDHPDFLAFVPAPGTVTGVLGSALAAGFAVPTGWRFTGSVSSAIESATIRWLAELLGLAPGTSGLFVSGGSTANLTALTAARDALVGTEACGATAYFSDQTHFSVPRALHVLGIAEARVRVLPGDANRRIPLPDLARRVAEDRCDGLRPFLVVANAGTTATGDVDPLAELASFCRDEGLWLHVDGAFGAPAALTGRGRGLLAGLDAADSVSVDPHKWLFQPAGTGCVLLRDPARLTRAFGVGLPGYLDAGATGHAEDEVDYLQWGVEQTREFRALRLWLSLKVFGADAFRAAVDRGLSIADEIAAYIESRPGLEVVTGPSLTVVTFRGLPPATTPLPSAEDTDRMVDEVCRDLRSQGRAMVVGATVGGRRVFRLCVINPRAECDGLRAVVDRIAELWSARAGSPQRPGAAL
ncbi:aminotransferase class V-fold PLP-dependent enzyme [Streptomyces sp. SPB4]|uniref:pyridoxal phosphate-dependent decarboxylase family protein n=1 Tax=Streptomyces sp. SPB4 TaxID=2940553 RepID=UPI0024748201|nr:aminotransferase class V-fold PLP-dependent enzyme [Streptomyces sp. SPB4]MDH6543857.1 aromatic-L-amino-acid decarboxylase [Streptomyces sp. SPB4]